MKTLVVVLAGLLAGSPSVAQDAARVALSGHVTDAVGGALSGVRVEVSAGSGAPKIARSDSRGAYSVVALGPGTYVVTATKDGFSAYGNGAVEVVAGSSTTLDIQLTLAPVSETLTVNSEAPGLSLDASANAGAIVIKGADLDALPDDPDELAEALQALAGPAAGPNGGQVFIDGFTGGRMPPKSSIREIRLNANPYSAEHDRLGFGRIEIFTKPGTDKLRGEGQYRFNDESLNSRNPFAPNKAPYQRRDWGANIGGPLMAKKASYFVDFDQRDVDDNQIVNATVLSPDLALVPFSLAVVTPQRRTSFSPRLDWQLNTVHALTVRYGYESSENRTGVGGFSLPSRAYDTGQHEHTFELSETAVVGKFINETRARYWDEVQTRSGNDSLPTLQVLDAFTGGGAQVGQSRNEQRRFELQNVSSWARGKHALRMGARLRTVSVDDVSPQGFGGSVLFAGGGGPELNASNQVVLGPNGQPISVSLTSIERYRRTVLLQGLGLSPAAVRALGGGASQLQISGGNPESSIGRWDVSPFIQDDWRVRTDLLLSAGLRYEAQNHLGDYRDLAPRFGFAWSPARTGAAGGGSTQPRTVIRGGFGIFYDRLSEDLTLRTQRYDGLRVQQYLVTDPALLDSLRFDAGGGATGLPSTATLTSFALPQTTWRIAPDLRAPYTMQSSLSVERQLPANITLSATFIGSQGRRQLRARNLNAPLPDGTQPLGPAAGSVYQIEASGRSNQYQAIVGLNNRLSRRFTVFTRYFVAWAKSDTDGADTFPANSYDIADEYGRASFDVRQRFVLGGNVSGPWGLRVSPFVQISSGRPFNITIGRDVNGDGLFNDRPALASMGAPGAITTPYGVFDVNPAVGAPVIARNLAEGPGFIVINVRLSKTIPLKRQRGATRPPDGEGPGGAGPGAGGPGMGGPGGPGGPGGGRGGFGGRGGRGGEGGGQGGGQGLTISISAQNVLNHTNLGNPVGNLSSAFFGQSLASAGGFGFGGPGGGGGGGGTAGNRRIELQARIGF